MKFVMSNNWDFFLSLVRLGIENSNKVLMSETVNWEVLEALAVEQGLSAVMVDGIERLPEGQRPPKQVLLQWIGESLQGFEYRYELYCRTIAEMAAFYNEHGFKMMILKGYACSLDWPKPEHRPCGDIDIWQFGQQKVADAVLVKEKSIKIDKERNHHTVFYWRDFMVENHYDFINVHHNKENPELEKVFKELGEDDSFSIEVYGERVYLPSPNLHALFLLRHAMAHFVATGITLRQLMDWAFFAKAHGKEIDWLWLEGVLEKFGMRRLYDIFNAICVEDLGFSVSTFPRVQFEPSLKERVLKDILEPEYNNDLPKNFFRRVVYKWKRWKANGWKYELCYNESRSSAFWHGVWMHLMKPKSI